MTLEELLEIVPEWNFKENKNYVPGDIVYTRPLNKIHFSIRSTSKYRYWDPISPEKVLERYNSKKEQINIF